MRKSENSELAGLVGVQIHPKRPNLYLSDLCVAGLGRVLLGTYESASEAGIAHDNAKMLAAHHGLLAKAPLRQRYNHPERARKMIEAGTLPPMPAALAKLQNRVSATLTKSIGVPAPKLNRVADAAKALESRVDRIEARLAALEARLL